MRSLLVSLAALVLMSSLSLSPTSAQKPPEGFTALFNGKDLTGWKATGKKEVWDVKDGLLYCQGGGGGWLMTEKEYGDYILSFEFRLPKNGNSGVALRAPLQGNPAYQGMEIQLIDDINWKGLQSWQHSGSVYNVIPASGTSINPPGEWNLMFIVLKGNDIKVVLNQKELVKDDLSKYFEKHGKEHPGLMRKTGHIGFQSYNHKVDFRNVWIKPLDKSK